MYVWPKEDFLDAPEKTVFLSIKRIFVSHPPCCSLKSKKNALRRIMVAATDLHTRYAIRHRGTDSYIATHCSRLIALIITPIHHLYHRPQKKKTLEDELILVCESDYRQYTGTGPFVGKLKWETGILDTGPRWVSYLRHCEFHTNFSLTAPEFSYYFSKKLDWASYYFSKKVGWVSYCRRGPVPRYSSTPESKSRWRTRYTSTNI